ncbi:hypothetical protein Tsubulata_003725 [Turnera subulata]|uniref:Bet v I/Major latex protein domain-containing protein n=1 Tax=Turnera subulata TaxID=218843 RepID=A0A9Q0GDQ0_9ROSI|nr:hypothetical protein Tsubulata_003725 [Turnera subulata]
MAQLAKLETQVPLKVSSDKFYTFYRDNLSRFTQLFPENVKSVEVVGGGEIKSGSVIHESYSIDGSPVMWTKFKVTFDDATKSIGFDFLGGDLLQLYKTFKAKMRVGAGHVNWSIEFEKANENVPNPAPYIGIITKFSKGLDAHLCK